MNYEKERSEGCQQAGRGAKRQVGGVFDPPKGLQYREIHGYRNSRG
jgi:hypothetical protein